MVNKPQMPENFYRDCSAFMRSQSFNYLMETMKAEAIDVFTFSSSNNPRAMQDANIKHRTITEMESAVENAAKKWDGR